MEFTPKQIIEQLDRYIIGQGNAKRAVDIAGRVSLPSSGKRLRLRI